MNQFDRSPSRRRLIQVLNTLHTPLTQLDRVLSYEGKGYRFESYMVYQFGELA